MIKINSFHFIVAAYLKCNRKVDAFTHFRFLFIVFDETSSGGSPAAQKQRKKILSLGTCFPLMTRVRVFLFRYIHLGTGGWTRMESLFELCH